MKLVLAYIDEHPKWNENPPITGMSHLSDYIGVLSSEESEKIAGHLDSGLQITDWLSPIPDPLDPSVSIHSDTFTDGEYFWSGMLSHFVKKYCADIPHDLKKKIIYDKRNINFDKSIHYDEIFWDLNERIRNDHDNSDLYITMKSNILE